MGVREAAAAATVLALLLLGARAAHAKVVSLDEGNWTVTLEDEWMVEFMAPWCPACTALKGTWRELASRSKELGIGVAEVDVTAAPGLSGRFLVTALPTIYHVVNGEFRQYKGPRDRESLYSYVEAKRWQMIDPLPWWKYPNSVQMSYVSYFFRMSQMLRVVHNVLLETYGLPTWGSYLVFALATILLGSLIGLLMVACIDFLYPQKSTGKRPSVQSPPKAAVEAEVMNDDLVDEEAENSDDEDESQDGEKNSASDSEDSESEADNKNASQNSSQDENSPSPSNVRRRNKKPIRKDN